LVIVTEWEQFRALDFRRLKDIMVSPVLVDLRNIYLPAEVARYGFVYDSVGRARNNGLNPAR
jgi:UDPglucose 6-dehydrogenase